MHSDVQNVVVRQCEADFYIGEWQLAHLNAAAAKSLFENALEKCPANFIERGAAKVEIARLK